MRHSPPTFVVAGAGRAGTTGLAEGLRSHPDVFVTDPKEPHYFALHGQRPDFRGPGDAQTINTTAVTSLSDYQALFPTLPTRYRALGEGSVSTLYYYERALPELLRVNPEMRVIVLLREPVSRAYSSFQYLRSQGREPEADFLAAVGLEEQRRADNWHHLWHYTAMSRYADALEALSEQLLPGHLGVWFHDDLEADYAATFAQVLEFLDLPAVPGLGEEVPRVNISGTPRLRPVQQGIWWASRHPAVRHAVRRLTTWRFREALKARLIRRSDVPEDVADALAPTFEADLARVRRLLAPRRDLPDWLSSATSSAV